MPTPASQRALVGLRDLSMLEWYVIPLLAIVFYIYTSEIKKARQTGCWDAVTTLSWFLFNPHLKFVHGESSDWRCHHGI